MSEAKKLPELDRQPASSSPGHANNPSNEPRLFDSGPVPSLPPLPHAKQHTASEAERAQRSFYEERLLRDKRVSRTLLIIAGCLVGFGAGVALATLIVLGSLDMGTIWIRNILHFLAGK